MVNSYCWIHNYLLLVFEWKGIVLLMNENINFILICYDYIFIQIKVIKVFYLCVKFGANVGKGMQCYTQGVNIGLVQSVRISPQSLQFLVLSFLATSEEIGNNRAKVRL